MTASAEKNVERCLAGVVGESFQRIAAAEARPELRLGYAYGAFQVRHAVQAHGSCCCLRKLLLLLSPCLVLPAAHTAVSPSTSLPQLRQSLGNYMQWPGTQWCTESYDPRFRPWYAAAASGPKDVVLVIDTRCVEGQRGDPLGPSPLAACLGLLLQAIPPCTSTFAPLDRSGPLDGS